MNRKAFLLFAALVCVFQAVAALAVGIGRHPFYVDENHFTETIRSFSGPLTIEKLRDYPQVNGPAMFVLYAKVGDLVGFDLWKLRLVSLVLSVGVYLLFYLTLARVLGRPTLAFLGALLLMVNPYMIRLSVFVFVDMMPMVLLAGFLLAATAGQAALPLALGAVLVVTRQYFVFAPAALTAFIVLGALARRRDGLRASLVAGGFLLSLVPFGLLVILWGGLHPPRGAFWIPAGEPLLHPGYLSAYVLLLPVYTAPILAWRWRAIYGSTLTLAISAALTPWYFLFPVELSRASQGVTPAIGVFHRFAQVVTNDSPTLQHVVLFAAFAAGLPVLVFLARDAVRRLRERRFDLALLLDLMVLVFFLLMPFSYQLWEKYIVPVLPPLILRVMMIGREEPAKTGNAAD